jgi:hypothetical protein
METPYQLLFVTGFPRSGTSWSNSIFYYCFDCGFANEVQFILKFHKKLFKYGELHKSENINRLISDLLSDNYFSLLKDKYKVELRQDDIFGSLSERSYADIVRTILRLVAQDLEKSIVGGKCPSLGWDLKTVSSLFPEAKLIHVVRDGRDCALSHYRMSWGLRNAYVAARQWSQYVREAKSVGAQLGPNRYMEFRYEDLLTKPDQFGMKLQQFLYGREYDEITRCVLEQISNNALPNNYYKWKKDMPIRDQGIFEAIAGDVLSQCGYDLTGNKVEIGLIEKMFRVTDDRLRRETSNIMRRFWPSLPEKLRKK